MVDTSQAVHSHFSFARGGVLRGVTDTFDETLPGRAELTVDVELADGAGSATPKVFVHGPGDVTALTRGRWRVSSRSEGRTTGRPAGSR